MKKFLLLCLAALLMASPVIVARQGPALTSVQDRKVKKTETVTFKVNMHCKKCVDKLTDKLSFIKGVEDLKISLDDKTVVISFGGDQLDAD